MAGAALALATWAGPAAAAAEPAEHQVVVGRYRLQSNPWVRDGER